MNKGGQIVILMIRLKFVILEQLLIFVTSKYAGVKNVTNMTNRAVQNIQKLSEPSATAPMVVELCINDCKNREIAEKLVQPVTPHPSRFRHFKRGKRLKKHDFQKLA